MTQYDDRVQYQRDKIEAEDWAKVPRSIHVHSCTSMWYDMTGIVRCLYGTLHQS